MPFDADTRTSGEPRATLDVSEVHPPRQWGLSGNIVAMKCDVCKTARASMIVTMLDYDIADADTAMCGDCACAAYRLEHGHRDALRHAAAALLERIWKATADEPLDPKEFAVNRLALLVEAGERTDCNLLAQLHEALDKWEARIAGPGFEQDAKRIDDLRRVWPRARAKPHDAQTAATLRLFRGDAPNASGGA